ncbi:MAG: glucuronate isomerase [Gemmatimonadaceae bacterium]
MSELRLDEDRFFDSDSAIRKVARELYAETKSLPLICPHGHVDAKLLAENRRFPNPAALLINSDPSVVRLLYSQGVALERLGIAALTGISVESDPKKIWKLFAERFHLFLGTPAGLWMNYVLHELFDIRVKLTASTALEVYDAIEEKLSSAEYRPRALFDRFNIEVLATTDSAIDSLDHHANIRTSGWHGRVIPTFRPDALFQIANSAWRGEFAKLESLHFNPITNIASFVRALGIRRSAFKAMGATATDHGVTYPYTAALDSHTANQIFARALQGSATGDDQRRFQAHMLMQMADLSLADGLVMQLHAGVLRNHNEQVVQHFGANVGGDIPIATEFTRNLRPLLNAYGNDPRFRLILFTVDETTYARELAPIAGHYPSVRLGSAWWFNDSIEGMQRFRQQTTETAGIWNTTGFSDDTRAFCSIPAQHDLSRRIDANYLGGLVARSVVDMEDARIMARAMAYELARDSYNLAPAANCGR